MTGLEKLRTRIEKSKSFVCVGLDSDFVQLPNRFRKEKYPQFAFNQWIIEETHSFVAAYKPNIAFYEARGEQGWHELFLTQHYLHENFPDIFTIADAKRADIDSTSQKYAEAFFDKLSFDAITLHPYLGSEALQPFLQRKDKVSIILCRTSNPGAAEVQDLKVNGQPLWWKIVDMVQKDWNKNENCILVMGATYPEELAQARAVSDDMFFLVPGIGTQGGDLFTVLKSGLNSHQSGLLINSSRSIIFAADPAKEVRALFENIQNYIQAVKND